MSPKQLIAKKNDNKITFSAFIPIENRKTTTPISRAIVIRIAMLNNMYAMFFIFNNFTVNIQSTI